MPSKGKNNDNFIDFPTKGTYNENIGCLVAMNRGESKTD